MYTYIPIYVHISFDLKNNVFIFSTLHHCILRLELLYLLVKMFYNCSDSSMCSTFMYT